MALSAKDWIQRLRGKSGQPTPPVEEKAPQAQKGKFAEKIVISMEAMPMISFKGLTLVREVPKLTPENYFKPVWTDADGFQVGAYHNIAMTISKDIPDVDALKKAFKAKYDEMVAEGWRIDTDKNGEPSKSCNPMALRIAKNGR